MSPVKRKLAEEVAQLLLARRRADVAGQPHHVHQRAVVAVQHVEFLLREVADGPGPCLR
jgi:hypothetical protein